MESGGPLGGVLEFLVYVRSMCMWWNEVFCVVCVGCVSVPVGVLTLSRGFLALWLIWSSL